MRRITVRRELPAGDPGRFLRAAEGRARGFWARGARWAAHAGVLAAVEAGGEAGRIARVRRAAARLAGEHDEPDGLRLYGGFAFRDDATTSGWWHGFPSALFHLPEVEFDGDADRPATLRVRALVAPDDDPEAAAAALEREADRWLRRMAEVETPPVVRVPGRTDEGNRIAWESAVERTLDAITRGEVRKAVLARTLDVELERPISPVDLVLALWRQHTGTHAFLFEPEPGRALLGAAPEAVVTLRGSDFAATAVAGSVASGDTREEQERLARGLLESAKDRAEQRVVAEEMISRLGSAGHEVEADPEPHVLALARIQHLETEIRARVRSGDALELVERLHPTPAVCGVPLGAALDLLARTEPFERGWYAGPVGWFDPGGDGHFVPALRTAVGDGRRWRLFAGAGIVEGSVPSAEWEETAIKFQPVLRALAECGAELDG
ncbi:MAG: isochorismate synthase [Longimicrobiales bacterium]|nr:isochorismate synthase [Longimicrobiales bacterium]